MSLLCPSLMEGRSATFEKNFLPARCLFNDGDKTKVFAVCLTTHQPVSVAVEPMLPNHDFDELLNEVNHPNMNNLIGIVPDPEVNLYYTIREHPTNSHSIKAYVQHYCKNSMEIRRKLQQVMKVLVALFGGLYKKDYGILPMNEEALLLCNNGNSVEVTLRREVLDKSEDFYYMKNFKDNLIAVAQLFSEDMYSNVEDGNNLLPMEKEFFMACQDFKVDLLDLVGYDYIRCDPMEWNEVDVGHNWDVVESDMEESFDVTGEDADEKGSDATSEKADVKVSDSDDAGVGSDYEKVVPDAEYDSDNGILNSETDEEEDDDDSYEIIEEGDIADLEVSNLEDADDAKEVHKAIPPTHLREPAKTSYEETITGAAAYITSTISGFSSWWSS